MKHSISLVHLLFLIVLLFVTTSCVRTTTVENIPPGGIGVERTTTRYTP